MNDKNNNYKPDTPSKTTALLQYLENYGGPDGIQESENALFDPQIKQLSITFASEISKSEEGTIIDIGCGKGILLQRLSEISEFNTKNKWIYAGIDYYENITEVSKLAFKLKYNRRVELIELKDFYGNWPVLETAPKPNIVIIRNVFHELDIDLTSKLLHHISKGLEIGECIIVQDLQTFPVGERNNVCWIPQNFQTLITACGFKTTLVEEPSRSGNRWFTLIGYKQKHIDLSLEELFQVIVTERNAQLKIWRTLGWLAPNDDLLRDVRIAKCDFDLQCNALNNQLLNAKSVEAIIPTREQEKIIIKNTFRQYFLLFDPIIISKLTKSVPKNQYFRDRKHDQDWLEEYFLNAEPLALITGGSLIGKTDLVNEVLYKRSHSRYPITIDVNTTSSVWTILEILLTSIGCKIPAELLVSLKQIEFSDIEHEFRQFISQFSDKVIIVFDHFERLLDPNNIILDKEITTFLSCITNQPNAKIIITSRRIPFINFVIQTKKFEVEPRIVGRFPQDTYVINILDDTIDRNKLGIKTYPSVLLESIDKHPFLTYIAAQIIKNEGHDSLNDPAFINLLKNKLREELVQRLVDDTSKSVVELFSLLRVPVPKEMVIELSNEKALNSALESGLVYISNTLENHIACIGALKIFVGTLEESEDSIDFHENQNNSLTQIHTNIAVWYERLYKKANNPQWLREMHYHHLCSGNTNKIGGFGVAYKGDIAASGNYWFHSKDYTQAMWAFKTARDLGMITYEIEMRIASCQMRTGHEKDGIQSYQKLIIQYSKYIGIKTSFIDSLLYIKKYKDALSFLTKYKFSPNDGAWIAHEYGKTYLGLHQYKEAANAFEIQLKLKKDEIVYYLLADVYYKMGDIKNEDNILNQGKNWFKNSVRIKCKFAAYLIRTGTNERMKEAKNILDDEGVK